MFGRRIYRCERGMLAKLTFLERRTMKQNSITLYTLLWSFVWNRNRVGFVLADVCLKSEGRRTIIMWVIRSPDNQTNQINQNRSLVYAFCVVNNVVFVPLGYVGVCRRLVLCHWGA